MQNREKAREEVKTLHAAAGRAQAGEFELASSRMDHGHLETTETLWWIATWEKEVEGEDS